MREAEVMLGFDHDNVVRIIGVAVQQSPWLQVQEFMCYGDLQCVRHTPLLLRLVVYTRFAFCAVHQLAWLFLRLGV